MICLTRKAESWLASGIEGTQDHAHGQKQVRGQSQMERRDHDMDGMGRLVQFQMKFPLYQLVHKGQPCPFPLLRIKPDLIRSTNRLVEAVDTRSQNEFCQKSVWLKGDSWGDSSFWLWCPLLEVYRAEWDVNLQQTMSLLVLCIPHGLGTHQDLTACCHCGLIGDKGRTLSWLIQICLQMNKNTHLEWRSYFGTTATFLFV